MTTFLGKKRLFDVFFFFIQSRGSLPPTPPNGRLPKVNRKTAPTHYTTLLLSTILYLLTYNKNYPENGTSSVPKSGVWYQAGTNRFSKNPYGGADG